MCECECENEKESEGEEESVRETPTHHTHTLTHKSSRTQHTHTSEMLVCFDEVFRHYDGSGRTVRGRATLGWDGTGQDRIG